MGHESYHEPVELLSEPTRNMHRAIISLIEELEAVDWYQQRAEACSDPELRAVLLHNKREEIEHAAMTLEWIRRTSTEFDEHLKMYLNTTGSILEVEAAAEAAGGDDGGGAAAPCEKGGLGIGSLRGG